MCTTLAASRQTKNLGITIKGTDFRPFYYPRFRHLTYGSVRLRGEERRFLLKIFVSALYTPSPVFLGAFRSGNFRAVRRRV